MMVQTPRIALIMPMLLATIQAVNAERKKPARTEKLSDKVTRLIYADGSEEWDIPARGEVQRIMKFVPSPAPTREEPRPRATNISRGYIPFSPEGRGGVLPEYRPATEEITDKVSIFASPGEYEPATFAVRPLKDLGSVTFSCGDFVGPKRARISASAADLYIVEPSAEQIGLDGPAANQVRWVAKWLRPGNTAKASLAQNVQVYLDVHVPEDARPGHYSAAVALKAQYGRASSLTVQLAVLPLKLARPMSWGFYRYDWLEPKVRAELHRFELNEMRRAGMTQCVIAPIHYQTRARVEKDGSVDFFIYDQCVKLYEEAGFPDPPVISMDGFMCSIVEAIGKQEELKFKEYLNPGVKAEEISAEVREFGGRVVRRIYDHALEAKWPNFYIYFADEPASGSYNMEKAKFMYGLARQFAPEMQTACTLYTLPWWSELKKLIDLNIAHYVHPCNNAEANRRWREMAGEQGTKLYGIDFIGPLDTFWEGRQITFTAEKGGLDGMMCWTQWVSSEQNEPFSPYQFLPGTWKGGPWCMREKDGRVWRSLPWIGLREGIDDSRYLRTLRRAIEDAEIAGNRDAAVRSRTRLQQVLDEIPWVPGVRVANSTWSANRADAARRQLAEAAIECRK